jgi:hypothetical protein
MNEMFTDNGIIYHIIPGEKTVEAGDEVYGWITGSDREHITVPPMVYYNWEGYKVTKINPCVFGVCPHLVSAMIPETVEDIHKEAFKTCPNLLLLVLPESLEFLNDSLYRECTFLREIRYYSLVYTIGNFCQMQVVKSRYRFFSTGPNHSVMEFNRYPEQFDWSLSNCVIHKYDFCGIVYTVTKKRYWWANTTKLSFDKGVCVAKMHYALRETWTTHDGFDIWL